MLIGQMLQVNVDARYTAEEVLSHPWVTDEGPGSDRYTEVDSEENQDGSIPEPQEPGQPSDLDKHHVL
ncbi:hypothetical protein CRUP_008685 [Coryphaenoides rupestris]|nr:hypothetical protein CRUP_008685 [Coryphaenoides rupestris]